MYTTVIYIFSISLITCSGVFVIKNFLVCFRASENGWKNIAVIILVALSLVLALGAAADAWSIDMIADELKVSIKNGTDTKHIQILERQIQSYTNEAARCVGIGYIMSITAYFIYRNIRKEIKMNYKRSKGHWDWSRISK